MQLIKVVRKWLSKVILILVLTSLVLCGCMSKATEAPLEPVLIATLPSSGQSTAAVSSTDAPLQPAPTLMPVTSASDAASQAGLIIFSMADGAYIHLFAYHPSYVSITRLTGDNWDDQSPSVSPDGSKIAYVSNRNGQQDIYIMDLLNNSITQVTNSSAYENSISWSADGSYIVYDVYQNEHYDLIIQSVVDPTEAPIQLTDGTSNNFQPAWSPDGANLAFVTDRTGRNEIWLARLQDPENRFVKIIGSEDAGYSHPAWSPDGMYLAACRNRDEDEIILIQTQNVSADPIRVGNGKDPVWLPDGSGMLATLVEPNQSEILAYAVTDHHLMLPPIPMAGSLHGYDWKAGNLYSYVQVWFARNPIAQPEALWQDTVSVAVGENGRRSLIALDDVEAPQASLSDAADDSFTQLRALVSQKVGWDFLGILENAALSSTSTDTPGISENWLYTGRAIALNLAPYEAGWMVTTREDFVGDLFWRVWIKCLDQDGTCGEPITAPTWNFNSRYSGDSQAYEDGGKESASPSGYWVDFTDLALRYGWERLPSLSNWQSYFQGIQFNVFVLRQSLTWKEALLEIYPLEQAVIIMGIEQ